MTDKQQDAISALSWEERSFPPSPEFAAQANAGPAIYEEAEADWRGFWMKQALARVSWFKEPTQIVDESNHPFYTWFADGELNLSYNCLDRHLEKGGDKVAYYWEGEPVGDARAITFKELHEEVCRFANALADLGVGKGDRVALYLGMVPELPVAMLACARLGAIHSVVFGGFSADSLAQRIQDAECKVLVTGDGAYRRGTVFPLKANSDTALETCPSVEHMVVVKRCNNEIAWTEGRDHWYHELIAAAAPYRKAEPLNAEDYLFILYTSGTTARPKGVVHSQGGYLASVAATHSLVFDIKPDDVYWCAADIGWVTGHSYIVYGPLNNHTTGVLYEGTPDYPDKDRIWQIVEKYKVTKYYTAPTAIRTFMKWGDQYPKSRDLSSLKLLGSVGEPINPEAWMWYHTVIGGERCPIVDTWWQTETGCIMITPLPGAVATKPGSATHPFPGHAADVVDDQGNSVPLGGGGYLVLTRPWPGMLRTLYKDPERYKETYWSQVPGKYFAGDGCKRDMDGYYWLLGRVDDVMNVAGHRLSTTEVESALVAHPAVAEAAVVARSDEMTGQAIAAFVTLRAGVVGDEALLKELRNWVGEKISPIARPKSIVFTDDLPKTRSGKIMRRLLRDISEQRHLGDVTTLANADVVREIASLSAAGTKQED
ncbi:MAG TPA: acetate--CoA ligase [Phycisphaerae bacterium]|nr:acetate--CoA ligase [Phycisphaerae bacterium]